MKAMKIPKNIKIGKHRYVIVEPQEMGASATKGEIDYYMEWIKIAQRCNVSGRTYSPKERAETFWHEVTHGILHSMNHPLYLNEKFVEEFAKRLNNAIHSAEF